MEEPPFICPYCGVELRLPDNVWYFTCDQCNNRLDLKSQFAFLRAIDAFKEGQDMLEKVSPRKRRKVFHALDQASLELFREAYSSLQVAFQAELAEEQRGLGVEMMTSMSDEFMKRGMVSSLETSYWNTLMVEQTAQYEYDIINEKIKALDGVGGILDRIKKWRWKNRQKQLIVSLANLNSKAIMLEKQMDFVDVPRARNKKWKPKPVS